MALNKSIDAITEKDLQALVDNGVPEGKSIEYKQNLPSNNREDKKEFLADVSSLANASGGDLIFGIKEQAGVAVELCGLSGIDADAELLRLENMLRDGLTPRIPGISMRSVRLQTSQVAIVIHIPRSWAQPHVVDFQGHWRFYSRNSAGKYPLDVTELRAAITLSETRAEQMRRFRSERLSAIIAGETPVAIEKGAKLVLHSIPFGAFDPASRFDVASLVNNPGRLQPIYAHGWNHRHNFDGFLTYTPNSKTSLSHTYAQVFRNGSIEAVETTLLSREKDGVGYIPSIAFEQALIQALPRFLSLQSELGVAPPLFIMLSLLGVSGYVMAVSPLRYNRDDTYPIDRTDLILPEIMIEDVDADPAATLKPAFDAIWSAAGWPYSINYEKDGKWVGHT